MTDTEKREKVIRGMECCLKAESSDDCVECPYFNGKTDCVRQKNTDALALLKEQEPLMMTLDEVRECNDWMWVEYQNGYSEWNKQSDTFAWDEGGIMWNDATFDSNDEYGTEWRCWTSRPSPEQMRETKWEGGQRCRMKKSN